MNLDSGTFSLESWHHQNWSNQMLSGDSSFSTNEESHLEFCSAHVQWGFSGPISMTLNRKKPPSWEGWYMNLKRIKKTWPTNPNQSHLCNRYRNYMLFGLIHIDVKSWENLWTFSMQQLPIGKMLESHMIYNDLNLEYESRLSLGVILRFLRFWAKDSRIQISIVYHQRTIQEHK